MIARVADHCFWFGRYLERIESMARLLQVTGALALDAELTPQQCWGPVVITSGEQENFARLCGEAAASDGETVQEYLSFRNDCPVSLVRSVAAARENARSIREVISLEAWESINELHLFMSGDGASGGAAREEFGELRYGFYKRVRREVQLCQGLLRATMLQDAPLDFIWLGVLLERLGQTARILDVHHHAFTAAAQNSAPQDDAHAVVETALWLSLLRACYGFEPFMKRHHGPVTGQAVASFLIFEEKFPRSVRHCLASARQRLWAIRPPAQLEMPGLRALERLRALDGWLTEKQTGALDAVTVHELLTQVVDETHSAAAEISLDLLGAPIVAAAP